MSLVDQTDIAGNANLRLKFIRRTQRDSEKATELSLRTSTSALSNVGWH